MTTYEKKILMENGTRHEIVSSNQDVDVRFYMSVDEGSYVAPHWHNSLEIIYMLEGSMKVKCENKEIEVRAGGHQSDQFKRDPFFLEYSE